MIASETLENFISKFWGYGNFQAPIWLVGMEEACGENDVPKRISAWQRRGERRLEDAADYHTEIGHPEHFQNGAKLQRTWSKLIRTYLAAYGANTNTGNTRKFQIGSLGRSDQSINRTCLIELMPLPSPSTKKWLIKQYTDLTYLQCRQDYFNRVAPERVDGLRKLISEFRPKAVVFYGLGYRTQWEEISGRLSKHPQHHRMLHGSVGGTTFVAMPHPVSHGVTNADYIAVGQLLRDSINA